MKRENDDLQKAEKLLMYTKDDDFCVLNDEFCVLNDEFCTTTDEFCF